MINNFIFRLCFIGLLFIFNNAFGYDDTEACKEYIKPCYFIIVLKNQIEITVREATNRANAYVSIQSIMDRVLNIRDIARFVAGSYWNSMSTDERERFIDEYGQYIKRIYTKQLYKYSTYDISILSIKHPKKDHYLINTRLSDERDVHNFIIVEFNLIALNDKHLLSDIKINNSISFSINQRTMIKNLINKNGVDGMIAYFQAENTAATR
ncbi:ABC transporter substrate-binding protein [Ehrlichia sp. JZT12]